MAEKIFEGTPFAKPIVWKEFPGKNEADFIAIPVLQGLNKVIHRYPLYQFKGDPEKEILTAQETFREFGGYPNLKVPNFFIVQGTFGKNDMYKPYMFVVDLIKGKNLVLKEFSPRERDQAVKVLSGFLDSFIDYASDKYTRGGLYPNDQLFFQYVYGKAPGDSEHKVYFVDLDLRFGLFDINHPEMESNEDFFNFIVGFIGGFIELAEMKLQKGCLVQVREHYIDFLNTILNDSHPFAYKAKLFKDIMEGRTSWG